MDKRTATSRPAQQIEPSSGMELDAKTAPAASDVDGADAARKSDMAPGERAWETLLEQNLGPFYLPRYKEAKAKGLVTAWDYVKDDPNLPRVLLIGDSISRGYTVPVRTALAGKVNVHRAPANCGSTTLGLQKLDVWLDGGPWDLIHFNFGVHDRNSASEDYADRLAAIVGRLQATGAKLVWANATPLPENSDTYRRGDCARLNAAAAEHMHRYGIPINDLYASVLPALKDYQNPDDCHFNAAGYAFLGKIVAERIRQELGIE